MRSALNVFVLGALALLVGCSAGSSDTLMHQPARDSSAADSNGNATTTTPSTTTAAAVAPAVSACSGVAAPTSLDDAKDGSDLHLAGTAVFFQSGNSVNRVLKTGQNKTPVFTSPNLVRSFVDSNSLLTVEQTSSADATATLRVFQADVAKDDQGNPTGVTPAFPSFSTVNLDPTQDPGGTTAGTNFNAAGTNVFGSDDNNFYLQADDGNGNSELIQVDRNALTQTVLVTSANVISSPQLASSAVWYVVDNQRIFMVPLDSEDATGDATTPGPATEVFGPTAAQCNLAVTEQNTFCSIGTEIDSTDLTGHPGKTLLTTEQSKISAAAFGPTIANNGTLFVRDIAPDPNVKNVIRVIATGGTPTESLAACNRGTVTGIAVDSDTIAWTEDGVGVFSTKRQ